MTPPRSRAGIVVRGVVQGVGFRWFVQRTATELGLDGWVANRTDGSVELVAEGPTDALDRLISSVRQGPEGAWVRDVDVRPEPPTSAGTGFHIRAGGHPGD